MHISLAEAELPLSCSKGQVSREAPIIHPQPTPNLMQFLFGFFWPANPALSLHKNATLWHLMNKITPWPEYRFGKENDPKDIQPSMNSYFLGGAPFHSHTCLSSDLGRLLTWRESAMRGGKVE